MGWDGGLSVGVERRRREPVCGIGDGENMRGKVPDGRPLVLLLHRLLIQTRDAGKGVDCNEDCACVGLRRERGRRVSERGRTGHPRPRWRLQLCSSMSRRNAGKGGAVIGNSSERGRVGGEGGRPHVNLLILVSEVQVMKHPWLVQKSQLCHIVHPFVAILFGKAFRGSQCQLHQNPYG